MNNLFEIVPENFFHPLATKSKTVYWECICLLYRVTSAQLSFGVERDVLVDELTYYFDSDMAADLDEEESEAGSRSSRDKANLILRKLERYGWLYVDVDYNYVQKINFRDYVVAVIQSLLSLEQEQKPEYQGFIYTIYTLSKAGTEQAGVALLQIVENTEKLITGLKSLNANIKKYIDELTRYSTIAKIMDSLYVSMKGKKVFVSEEIPIVEISPFEREEKLSRMKDKLKKTLSAEKINQYVLELLNGRDSMQASEISFTDMETFIRLIYIRLYGQRKNMKYYLEMKEMMEKDGYRFRDFIIKRK